MDYKIFSKTPCLVELGEQRYKLDEAIGLVISDYDNSPIIASPISSNLIPKTFYLSAPSKEDRIISYKNFDEIEIVFNRLPTNLLAEKNLNGRHVAVYENQIIISQANNVITHYLEKELKNIEISTKLNFVSITANCGDDKYLFLFDGKEFVELSGYYTENKNQIIATYKLNNITKHAVQLVIENQNNKLNLQKKLLYSKNKPKLFKNNNIIALQFFEAIKYEDKNLAKFLLADELKNCDLSFFGKFEECKLGDDGLVYLIKKDKQNHFTATAYQLYYKNYKIQNIIEL